jgi:hypothetical protein
VDFNLGAHTRRLYEACGVRQGVLAIAIAHELAFESARQVEVTNTRLARIESSVPRLAVALGPAVVVTQIAVVFARIRFT